MVGKGDIIRNVVHFEWIDLKASDTNAIIIQSRM